MHRQPLTSMRVLRQTVHLDWLSARGIASYRRETQIVAELARKLKKLVTWHQEGQLRQFRQHAPAVRGDEEMEAEENERRWRRNAPKYRLQASNWQMERNGAHTILATDADLYLRYGAPKTKSLVLNAMDAAERENAQYPESAKGGQADKRGRAVDTTDANSPSPSILSVSGRVRGMRAVELKGIMASVGLMVNALSLNVRVKTWQAEALRDNGPVGNQATAPASLRGTQGNNLISSQIQWQVEINKWISNTRATEFEDKDIEEEEEEPTLVPNPTRAPPKIKN
ncbi:hypothetical protein K438DRAFT_1780257 [Mycena galopus ATCC 62051]|nr:hypothetical protein K438DRAFT_1780257 [Mycena galopus ATCC 62051]